MPYTRTNIKRDIEDIGSVFDGPPDLEFHATASPSDIRTTRKKRCTSSCAGADV
jgi:hypothetical protein